MKEKKNIFIWTLFDFANTSFSITVVTLVYAVYFKEVVCNNQPVGDFYWSIATGLSMLIVALISPVLGAISDFSFNKKRFLLFFTLLCIVSTGMLYFVNGGMILAGIIFFIFANIGFEAGLVFYDSFLPEITSEKNFGRVSGYGFAMGYLGSFASLLIVQWLHSANAIKLTFPAAGLFFLLFALPFFLFLKEKKGTVTRGISFIKLGYERVSFTLKNLKNFRNLGNFLISFFFYIEGVNTAIYFSGIYAATTIGFTMDELIIFFMTTQTTAIIGSVLFGVIGDHIGHKKTIYITLFIWLAVIISATLVTTKGWFYVVGVFAGLGMGSTQSVSRSLMSTLIPSDKKTEFFGFYSFFGKSSAIIGPLVFGLVSWIFNSQRMAILSVLIFFIIGMFLLSKVKEADKELAV